MLANQFSTREAYLLKSRRVWSVQKCTSRNGKPRQKSYEKSVAIDGWSCRADKEALVQAANRHDEVDCAKTQAYKLASGL